MSHSSTSSSEPAIDGLVPSPAGLLSLGRRRLGAVLVVALFLGALAATALVDLLMPAPLPRLIGNEANREEARRSRATWHDGSAARLLEHDLRLRSRVRRTLGPYYTLALFRFLDEAQGRVVVGRDGWLFLTGRTLLPDSRPAEVGLAAARIAALERRLAAFGVTLITVPVPRKSAVYRDALPRGVDPRAELDARLGGALAARGVWAADLWPIYEQHRRNGDGELLYFQSDSHWTETAQALASAEICRVAGLETIPRWRRLVASGREPQERDHLDYIGLDTLPEPALDFLDLPTVAGYQIERYDGRVLKIHGNPPRMFRMAVAGTSFTARRQLPLYLQVHCGERVWNAAQAASHPVWTVLRFLDERLGLDADRLAEGEPVLPELLVLELPNHNVFGRTALAGAEELFARRPPPEPLVPLRRLTREKTLRGGGEVRVEGIRHLATLRPGVFLHSGDGVADLRLRGRITGTALEVLVVHGDLTLRYPWPPERGALVIPLVAASPTGRGIELFADGSGAERPGTLRLSSVEVAAHLDTTRQVEGRPHRLEVAGDGWRQGMAFPEAPRIPRHAALLVDLDLHGRDITAPPPELVIYGRSESGAGPPRSLVVELAPVREAGRVLVSLTPLAGEHLVSAEVRGAGAAPRRAVARGLFLPHARVSGVP